MKVLIKRSPAFSPQAYKQRQSTISTSEFSWNSFPHRIESQIHRVSKNILAKRAHRTWMIGQCHSFVVTSPVLTYFQNGEVLSNELLSEERGSTKAFQEHELYAIPVSKWIDSDMNVQHSLSLLVPS